MGVLALYAICADVVVSEESRAKHLRELLLLVRLLFQFLVLVFEQRRLLLGIRHALQVELVLH